MVMQAPNNRFDDLVDDLDKKGQKKLNEKKYPFLEWILLGSTLTDPSPYQNGKIELFDDQRIKLIMWIASFVREKIQEISRWCEEQWNQDHEEFTEDSLDYNDPNPEKFIEVALNFLPPNRRNDVTLTYEEEETVFFDGGCTVSPSGYNIQAENSGNILFAQLACKLADAHFSVQWAHENLRKLDIIKYDLVLRTRTSLGELCDFGKKYDAGE